jgi:hypothetical protein
VVTGGVRTERRDWLLIALGLLASFFVLPHRLGYDGLDRFNDIEGLLHHGSVSGSRFSLVMPLLSAPFLLLGEVVKSPAWWAGHFNVIVVAVTVVVAARLVRGYPGAELFRTTVLVLLFASYLENRLWDYNAEILTAALVGVGVVAVETGRARTRGWWAIVIGAVNTPAAIVGVAVLAGREAFRQRRLRGFWPVIAVGVLIAAEAWIRRGSPFDSGYGGNHGPHGLLPYSGRPGFSYPFLFGLLSILFSFGRGLLFFFPALLFWFDRQTRRRIGQPARRILVAGLLFTAALVLAYSKWWAWFGGTATGPRFFLFAAIPASILLAARLHARPSSMGTSLLTLGALLLGTWTAVVGALSGPRPEEICFGKYEPLCLYTPDFSPLGYPLVSFPHLAARPTLAALLCVAASVYLATPTLNSLLRRAREKRQTTLEKFRGWSV